MDTKINGNKVSITMTAERLQAMQDNGMTLWNTPNGVNLYWNSQPSFTNDYGVAIAHDFAESEGYDSLEGFDDDATFTLTLKLDKDGNPRFN